MATQRKTAEQAFLQDIIEHPDDDTPRLIYADRFIMGEELLSLIRRRRA